MIYSFSRAVLLLFAVLIIVSGSKPPPPQKPMSDLPQIQGRTIEPPRSFSLLVEECFDTGIEGWQGFAQEGSLSEASWDPSGRLHWSVAPAPQKTAALVHKWPELPGADGTALPSV